MKTFKQYGRPLAVAIAVVLMGNVAFASPGAIYTTNSTGTVVNENTFYNARTEVYLNGGPKNITGGNKLPNGVYYFQVTEPEGALLSSDPAVCRQLRVTDGVVSGAVAAPSPVTYQEPITGETKTCQQHSEGPLCNHDDKDGSCTTVISNKKTVQLFPFSRTTNPGGQYKAWLIAQTSDTSIDANDPRILNFSNSDEKTDSFKVKEPPEPPVSLNIFGIKFYDTNVNGTRDAGEEGIPDWKIYLYGDASSNTDTVHTDDVNKGTYLFDGLVAGNYGVCELMPSASPIWKPTTVTSFNDITLPPANPADAVKDFGNVCLGKGGGLTLGFWSNKNGQALVSADGLVMLVRLNLSNANGALPESSPTNYTDFRNWLLKATATNMAYMLSAQLSAMELNVLNGKVKQDAIVFAGKAPDSCSLLSSNPVPSTILSVTGFININDLMNAANSSLKSNQKTVAGIDNPDARNCQEFMKNALDEANNDRNFVQSSACDVIYSGTETSCTP